MCIPSSSGPGREAIGMYKEIAREGRKKWEKRVKRKKVRKSERKNERESERASNVHPESSNLI